MADPTSAEPTSTIAVVSDNAEQRRALESQLARAGYHVTSFESAAALLAPGTGGAAEVVCLDLGRDEVEGFEALRRVHERDAGRPILTLDRDRGPQAAADTGRRGSYEHLLLPVTDERLVPAVRRAVAHRALNLRAQQLQVQLDERRGRGPLLGTSAVIRSLSQQIDRLRDSDMPVCIIGETGVGKELVARAIHDHGSRRGAPFIAVGCAAVNPAMQEAELFGQERGTTGVHRGCFERADGGTLFLDEVVDLDPATQASLLRTLQQGTVRRAGGTQDVPVNVRLITASSRRLDDEVRDHRFREDLFYRVHVYALHVPPLRDRKEDIPQLAAHFMEKIRQDSGLGAERISAEALDVLMRHDWPGNVRELQNVVHRAMLACDGRELGREHLPAQLGGSAAASGPLGGEPARSDKEVVPLRELERREIMKALSTTGGSVAQAARRLGIGRATLYRRLSELNLPPPTVALRNALAAGGAMPAPREATEE